MKQNKRIAILLPLIAALTVLIAIFSNKDKEEIYQHDSGFVFGTVYNITYESKENLKADIEAALQNIDNSLSPFNKHSIITAVNNNEPHTLDKHFQKVWEIAAYVNKETNGAFDITVAPLVNAWGFGFKNGTKPSHHEVDSLKEIIGFSKVNLNNGSITKQDPRIMLDCSAVAKGYGVDVVANLLREKGISNFMVEIGGEIVTSGNNPDNKPWRIGVTKPSDDSLNVNNEIQTILNVTDKAMATSGNYRNFYYQDGKKYAHTIDPGTGYPVQHSILSSTVICDDCATADAFATSFMVLGLEKAKSVLSKHPELMAYFIYSDEDGNYAVWFSPALKDKISN